MKNETAQRLARALLIAMFAAAIWSWRSAPEQIPIHWDITGQINGYGSKFTGLALMPLIALAGYALLGLVQVMPPAGLGGRAMKALSWFRLAYMIVMAGAFGVIVAVARGANINMNHVIFPVLAIMMIASVNLVVQLSRSKAARTAPPGGGIRV